MNHASTLGSRVCGPCSKRLMCLESSTFACHSRTTGQKVWGFPKTGVSFWEPHIARTQKREGYMKGSLFSKSTV